MSNKISLLRICQALFLSGGLVLSSSSAISFATLDSKQSAPIQSQAILGDSLSEIVSLNTATPELQQQVEAIMQRYSFLETGMVFVDLESGNYLSVNGDHSFPAASTIKFPVLMAFLQDLDAGKVRLDESLVMQENLIASGSGEMQDMPIGSRFSALETITQMITISDNTATNMIIDRLGGITALNTRFIQWQLNDTKINDWLGDFQGTNVTTSTDMVRLLALLTTDKLLSSSSKALAFDIMRRTETKTLLPAGLGAGADIAHKTGDIGFAIGDVGIITTPTGRQYLASIYVIRPYNDVRGRYFIQQISSAVYSYLSAL